MLTDSQGRQVDFKHSVLILTSNVGSSVTGKNHLLGFSPLSDSESRRAAAEEQRKEQLKQTFRPEFLNRLDAILTFAPLGKEQLALIARRQLDLCGQRLRDMSITLEYDDAVVEHLIKAAQNPDLGARPLRREITSKIENVLATKMLGGELFAGDRVHLIVQENGFDCQIHRSNRETGFHLLSPPKSEEKEP